MKTEVSLQLVCLIVTLFFSAVSLADEGVSPGSPGGQSTERAATDAAQPVNKDIIERLAKAKPMPPKATPKGGFSLHRSGPPGYRVDDFGTVSKDLDGDASTTPAGSGVERAIKKESGSVTPPTKSASPTFRGTADPAGGPTVTRKVFGTDDRLLIRHTTEYPFRAIGLLEMEFSGGYSTCSGALIAPRYVLTAAHCLFHAETREWARNVNFFPGYDGGNAPYGYYPGARMHVLSGYINAPSRTYDWEHVIHDLALVRLKGNAGNQVGWLAFAYEDSLPPFVGNIVGYPADKPSGTMWRASCDVNPFDGYPDLFETQCDTYPGSSGSSIYDFDKPTNSRTVYGVNVAENSQSNTSVRLTGPYYCWLRETMGQGC